MALINPSRWPHDTPPYRLRSEAQKLANAIGDLVGASGVLGAGVTAVELGNEVNRTTKLTINTTLPAIVGGTDLAVGRLVYTFPAGEVIVESASFSLAITETQGNIDADTPEIGIGTTIGVGAIATLSTTMENIILGSPAAANCTGTPLVKTAIPTAAVPFVIAAAAAHTIYINVADGWAASGDVAALLTGTLILNWRRMA